MRHWWYGAMLVVGAGLLWCGCGWGRSAAATANRLGHCEWDRFDAKVKRWLRLDVPAVDVDSLYRGGVAWQEALLLDSRTPEEYRVSHLPGAVFVGYPMSDTATTLRGEPRERPIVVYCSIGYRSERVARQLRAQGYTQVYNLYGSIFEWANRGYPLVDSSGATTRLIHTYSHAWGRYVTAPGYVRLPAGACVRE